MECSRLKSWLTVLLWFVFYKGTALLEADGAREKSPVRALATVFHITHTSVLLRRLTVLP